MTDRPIAPPDGDARPVRRPRTRGEGQWALGYHEPLNPAEQIKKERRAARRP